MQAPDQLLDVLKCNVCNNLLSYFPVNEHLNLGSVCGRCPLPEAENDNFQVIRNVTYETTAKLFKFPCRYKGNGDGCMEYLYPNEIPEHEENCYYKTIDCPISGCTFHGVQYKLLSHFEEKHPIHLLLDPKFEVDFLNTYDKYYLINYSEEIFSLHIKFNSTTSLFTCSVLYIGSNQEENYFKYKLILENGSRTKKLECAEGSTSKSDENHITKVNTADIMKSLKDPTIIVGYIKLYENDPNLKNETRQEPSSDNILKAFECPICMECMIPPIYSCVTGHPICNECKLKQKICPTCRGNIADTRNFPLETLLDTQQIIYPCKFIDTGCIYGAKYDKIKEHEKYCSFSLHECPLKDYEDCKSKMTVKNMYTHVRQQHYDNLLEVDKITVPVTQDYFNNTDEFCYILKNYRNVFKLHYAYRNSTFYWAMQMFGPQDQASKYHFEIDIKDNNTNNLRVYIKGTVTGATEKGQAFKDGKRFLSLRHEQVKDMITDDFTYKVRILK